MKKILAVVFMAIFMLAITGCAGNKTEPEKKPETPQPKAGDINFSIIDPAGAPGKIGDLVNKLKTSASASLVEEDGGTYVLVTWGEQRTGGFDAKIEKVTQSVGAGQKATATVRALLTAPKPEDVVTQSITYPLVLAKLDTGRKPDEITFIVQRVQPAGRTPEANVTETPKARPPKEQQAEKTINIIVEQPKPGAAVTSPFLVSGRARVFEANVQIRLLDEKGATITRKYVTATAGAPEWGNFNTSIQYAAPVVPRKATLQVYTESAKDGSVQDLVSIPLTLK